MASKYKITGVITHVSEVEKGVSKNGKAWTKQFIVVEETDEEYPNSVKLDFFNKEELQNAEGEMVTVEFNTRCNEFNGKYFQSCSGWNITTLSRVTPNATQPTTQPELLPENNDLPF